MKYLATILLIGLMSSAAVSQVTASDTAAPNKKASSSRGKSSDENAHWERASAVLEPADRVAALTGFLEAFPRSARAGEAAAMIVAAASIAGNEKLQIGDVAAAATLFKTATLRAPRPSSDELFNDTLSKFPANLFFRGARAEAVEIAKMLEEIAGTNISQTLVVAGFYLSIENGTEAKRLAEKAIEAEPGSAAAYQTLGLANRMEFQLEESAAAYARALEIEPESLSSRRGLAEMKRSLGRADEAATLYREILSSDPANIGAQTGLVLALFDSGRRAEAEAEMSRSLDGNPGNVILLAGAAYWYAVNNEGARAIGLARQAIDHDPRFIWSHIALARGQLSTNDPIAAEKTLLAARRYGNFPTLEYEIASARAAAGLYREAAEELAKSFTVEDGVVKTFLGGRVARGSKDFTELVGFERRASIFAPTAADSPENATRLTSLLELKQAIDSPEPRPEDATRAADAFITGTDKMQVYRQIFAATQLLEKDVALPTVIEISKAAAANIDTGLDVPSASIAVMAGELYETRTLAAARGEYVNVPDIPRPTLSAILRGRVEEVNGWASHKLNDREEAVVRLKRAVSVLPVDSAWWRSSTWKLGAALAASGSDAEALEVYIRSYKSAGADPGRYAVIEELYKKIYGRTDGLAERIGADPVSPVPADARASTPPAAATPDAVRPEVRQPTSIPAIVPVATPDPGVAVRTPERAVAVLRPGSIPSIVPIATPKDEPVAIPSPEAFIEPEAAVPMPTPDEAIAVIETPDPTPDEIEPITELIEPEVQTPELIPEAVEPEPTPESVEPEPITTPEPETEAETFPAIVPVPVDDEPAKPVAEVTPTRSSSVNLFPPIIINIPPPERKRIAEKRDERMGSDETTGEVTAPAPEPAAIVPCTITASEDNVTVAASGATVGIVVGLGDDAPVDDITATTTSPKDISVRREVIEGMDTRALFVVRSISNKPGIYQVSFEMPCGRKEIVVRVR